MFLQSNRAETPNSGPREGISYFLTAGVGAGECSLQPHLHSNQILHTGPLTHLIMGSASLQSMLYQWMPAVILLSALYVAYVRLFYTDKKNLGKWSNQSFVNEIKDTSEQS